MKKTNYKRWSYSQLTLYEACPQHWKFKYLDQLPDGPQHPAAAKGVRIHQELEDFINKPRARKVPESLAKLTSRILAAKALGAVGEAEVFLDRSWQRVTEDDAWGVIKVDLTWVERDTLEVVDLKSGRVKDYTDQGRFYLGGLLNVVQPPFSRAVARQWYTTGEIMPRRDVIFTKAQLQGIQREIGMRVARRDADVELKPKPGSACRYCPYARTLKGPCRYG